MLCVFTFLCLKDVCSVDLNRGSSGNAGKTSIFVSLLNFTGIKLSTQISMISCLTVIISHILFCHATRQDDKNVCHDIGDKMKFFLDKIYFSTFFAEVSHLGRVLLRSICNFYVIIMYSTTSILN